MSMTHRTHVLTLVLAVTALGIPLAGCGGGDEPQSQPLQRQQPPPGMGQAPTSSTPTHPGAAAAAMPSPGEPGFASFLGIRAPMPEEWTEQTPQSMMHHAVYRVPAPPESGAAAAEIVVFFFGPGQGGPIDDNIERWEQQFRSPQGGNVTADVHTFEADGLPITFVELEGEYRGMGAIYAPNQLFLTAIVDTPGNQRIFIRFVGDHDTVSANREAFMAMIEGVEWVGQ